MTCINLQMEYFSRSWCEIDGSESVITRIRVDYECQHLRPEQLVSHIDISSNGQSPSNEIF